MNNEISINTLTQKIVDHLITHAEQLRLGVSKDQTGATLIDAGINCLGGLEAGRLISEVCLGGLGNVSLLHTNTAPQWPCLLYTSPSPRDA